MVKHRRSRSYLTPNEVAELLLVSPVTVRQWASKGKLAAELTPGGHRRFLRHNVERFAREHGISLQPPGGDELRVLIADDDEGFARYLVEVLGETNDPVAVEVALDGFDAGNKIRTFQPHALLLDLRMPGIDGFEVCRRLKADTATRAVRVVALTGYYAPEAAIKIKALGGEACLPKPVDIAQLLDLLGLGYDPVELVVEA